MIKHSTQRWEVNSVVKVGFMQLIVKFAIATPNDGAPDVYFLSNLAETKLFQFVPHHGLTSITLEEAEAKIAYFRKTLEQIAANEAARVAKQAQCRAKFNEVFAAVA